MRTRPRMLHRLMIHRCLAASVWLACATAPTLGGNDGGASASPNILIVMADDLGYGDIGAFGSQVIATPRIDDLCASGVRRDSFYAHPTCSPTRAAMLTGRYAHRVGVPIAIGAWATRGLATEETTIAEVLKTVGYRTAVFGKWHVGDAPEQLPGAQGFDEFRGLLWGPTGLPLVLQDTTLGTLEYEPDQVYDTFDVTTKSLDFIDRSVVAAEPFFCFASYVVPHEPATASPAFQGISADGRDYGDSVEELDASVGVLLDHLTTLGVRDDTVVIFLSDNGATFQRNPYQDGSNLPFSNGKGTTWEGGVRVPACVSWPAQIQSGAVQDGPLSVTDLFPTLAGIAGATLDPAITLDGFDILAVLQGGAPDPFRMVHLASGADFDAVRRGRYKYRQGKLYDLVLDPGEKVDLASVLAAEAASLAQALSAIQTSVQNDHRPAGESSRLVARFRADTGVASPLDGHSWSSQSLDPLTFVVQDQDPAEDLTLENANGRGTFITPNRAFSLGEYSNRINLIGDLSSAGLSDVGPFTVGVWFHPYEGGTPENTALLDIGDHGAGLSFTIGDAGVLGDDQAAGRLDDLLVRIGGSLSPNSATLAVDLPDQPAVEFMHLGAVYHESGDLIVYVNGFEEGRVFAPGVDCGVSGTWSLFAPEGEMGGGAGPGVLPFLATRSRGEIAGLSILDRALRRNEMQSEYARYSPVIYCQGRSNAAGRVAKLAMHGSFRRPDNRLFAELNGLPSGSLGFLLASLEQHRTNISNGTLCIRGNILRFSAQVLQADSAGHAAGLVDFTLAPNAYVNHPSSLWNFQYWYRDGSGSNFSNGLQLTFGG